MKSEKITCKKNVAIVPPSQNKSLNLLGCYVSQQCVVWQVCHKSLSERIMDK